MIALLQSTFHHRSILPEELLFGIQDQLAKHKMHLVLVKLPDSELIKNGAMPRLLEECMCDGIIY